MRLIILLLIFNVFIFSGCVVSNDTSGPYSDSKNFKIIKKEFYNSNNANKPNGKYVYTLSSYYFYNDSSKNGLDQFRIISNKDFEVGEELILTTSKMENLQ